MKDIVIFKIILIYHFILIKIFIKICRNIFCIYNIAYINQIIFSVSLKKKFNHFMHYKKKKNIIHQNHKYT